MISFLTYLSGDRRTKMATITTTSCTCNDVSRQTDPGEMAPTATWRKGIVTSKWADFGDGMVVVLLEELSGS